MNKLIRKLMMKVGIGWITGQVRAAAEGKLGPGWQRVYWELAGRKRVLSIALAIVAGSLAIGGYPHTAEVMGTIATVGVSLGFVDKNWRDEASGDTFKDTPWFIFLSKNSPIVTVVLGAGYFWFAGADCTLGDWCERLRVTDLLIGGAFVQMGLIDAAWNAQPPQIVTPPAEPKP
jgi:hypothetical protein